MSSLVNRLFGGGKGSKPPTTGEAIQKLRETEEMLIKKQEFLEKKIGDEIKVAKQNGTKNKRGMFVRFVPISCYFSSKFSLYFISFIDWLKQPPLNRVGSCLLLYSLSQTR